MKYIDLNMVRAGVVKHPAEWNWCGYRELIGVRKRYCIVDATEVLTRFDKSALVEFQTNYKQSIEEDIERGILKRDVIWTESIAVGCESFVRQTQEQTTNRIEFELKETGVNQWVLREQPDAYG